MNYSVRIWDENNEENYFVMDCIDGLIGSDGGGRIKYDPEKMHEALDKVREADIGD